MNEAESARRSRRSAPSAASGEFLDVPIRTYFAGMSVRLSFAMATVIEPQIC